MPVSINGNTGITFPDGSVQPAAASPYTLKNKIINGDFRIDQRNAGASVTPLTSGDWYATDRWRYYIDQSSKFSSQQSSVAPSGFVNSILVTSLSSYSVASGESFTLTQNIEGLNTGDLAWGTASASSVTLSFWVRSSLTGTFGGSVTNSAINRSYPFSYTISVANTWEQKTVTIAGDTTGTWLTTNGIGLRVFFSLGTGSTKLGTVGSWASSDFRGATGQTNVVGTNGATFYITGVQLEIGSSATPFERRLYNQELANCQRYYYRTTPASGSAFGFGWNANTTISVVAGSFPVPMRVKPSALEQSGTASHYKIAHGVVETTCSAVPTYDSTTSETIYAANFTVASGLTAGQGSGGRSNNASAYLGYSAEL